MRGGVAKGGRSKFSPNYVFAITAIGLGILIGYSLAYFALDLMFKSSLQQPLKLSSDQEGLFASAASGAADSPRPVKWAGDTVHSIVTSSGDAYQNFQTRIMYATYQLVQKEPGGEKMTGFTRILHRSVPDLLMRIIPTYHAWDVLKPACDAWCDYPVANRPVAIQQWIEAATANASMIQGAWVLMLECDYVWMRPAQVPGDAYDPSVAGIQFEFDYITPQWQTEWMKMLAPNVDPNAIPASGPAPVMLRFAQWQLLGPDYRTASATMEANANMTNALEWVREMYAWDVAVAMHADKVKVVTSKYPDTLLIVQPPFDDGLGKAVLCHYTWGALYHEGNSTKGKQVYRWEKRDYNDIKFVIQVPLIPMPPEYKDGWILEFESPLTRVRHDLVVLMLTQMNKVIATLPNIQAEQDYLDQHAMPEFITWRATQASQHAVTRR